MFLLPVREILPVNFNKPLWVLGAFISPFNTNFIVPHGKLEGTGWQVWKTRGEDLFIIILLNPIHKTNLFGIQPSIMAGAFELSWRARAFEISLWKWYCSNPLCLAELSNCWQAQHQNALLGCGEVEGHDRVTAKRISLAAGASKEVVIWNLEMERDTRVRWGGGGDGWRLEVKIEDRVRGHGSIWGKALRR